MKIPFTKQQIIIGILLVITIWWFMSKSIRKSELIYFFSPDCPHCQDFMPIWDSLSLSVNKKKINCNTQDCPGIEALPTIMMNGQQFKGERTKENIEAFVNKNV